MKQRPAPQSDSTVLAVLHRSAQGWRGLIASTRLAKPSILDARDFSSDRLGGGRLEDWLKQHQVGSVLCVLPASAVICRNCPLPDAPPQQLEDAVRLQAEMHLMGIAPAHRVGMAVQPAATGETSRTGIILAWPQAATFEGPPTDRPVSYIPDVAALAALLNGQRPDEPLLWLDRGDGSVALALTHAGGVVLRGTREDAADRETWQRRIGGIVAETALNVGHTGAFVDSAAAIAREKAGSLDAKEAALFIPDELIAMAAARFDKGQISSEWWSRYGIAAGALLARTGQLAGLTRMRQDPPIERPSRVRNTLETLSRPRAAAMVVIACVLVLMFGPLAVAGARLMILQWRFGDAATQLESANQVKNQLAMYRELGEKTWPMTKLMADITNNTPLGIDLERVQIQSGKDFSVSGTALGYEGRSPTETVALMQEQLRNSTLFTDLSVTWGSSSNLGSYKFDLTGKVTNPYKWVTYPEDRDFGVKTYAMRLYGNAASRTAAPPKDPDEDEEPVDVAQQPKDEPADQDDAEVEVATADDGTDRGTGRASPRATRPLPGGDAAMPGSDDAEGPAPHEDIPPPLTEEQIRAMSLTEANEAWVKVSKARKYAKGDAELETRLKKEFEQITAHVKTLRSRGSS